jgi:hypothetical protein
MRALAYSLLLGLLFSLGGCASTEEKKDPNQVTTIPWNKPERWEGTGPFGSMMPGAGNY